MTALRVRPEADRDADAAAEYLAIEANLDIAIQFLAALERAYLRLVEHSHVGVPVMAFEPRLSGLRFWPVPGFERYLVFYVPGPAHIDIVRVLHGARDLGPLFQDEIEDG